MPLSMKGPWWALCPRLLPLSAAAPAPAPWSCSSCNAPGMRSPRASVQLCLMPGTLPTRRPACSRSLSKCHLLGTPSLTTPFMLQRAPFSLRYIDGKNVHTGLPHPPPHPCLLQCHFSAPSFKRWQIECNRNDGMPPSQRLAYICSLKTQLLPGEQAQAGPLEVRTHVGQNCPEAILDDPVTTHTGASPAKTREEPS